MFNNKKIDYLESQIETLYSQNNDLIDIIQGLKMRVNILETILSNQKAPEKTTSVVTKGIPAPILNSIEKGDFNVLGGYADANTIINNYK